MTRKYEFFTHSDFKCGRDLGALLLNPRGTRHPLIGRKLWRLYQSILEFPGSRNPSCSKTRLRLATGMHPEFR